MRTSAKLTAAGLATAALFTLSGLSSVAQAAPVTAPAAVSTAVSTEQTVAAEGQQDEGQLTAQGTRAFWITNLSSRILTLDDAWGTTGWPATTRTDLLVGDSVPVGQTLKPGQTMQIEVRDWNSHGISLIFGDGGHDQVAVNTHVWAVSRYSNGFSSYGRVDAGGQDITLTDAPGSETVIPSSNRRQQAGLADQLCGRADATCTFTSTGFEKSEKDKNGRVVKKVLGDRHYIGEALLNGTDVEQQVSFVSKDKVGTKTSIEVSAGVSVGIQGLAATEMSIKHLTEWTAEHEFTRDMTVKARSGTAAWATTQQPVVRMTGDITVLFHGARIVLRDVTFETPDKSGTVQGEIKYHQRTLTAQELEDADGQVLETDPADAAAPGSGITGEVVTLDDGILNSDVDAAPAGG